MGHPIGKKNRKWTPEKKEQIVLEYLNGETGQKTFARKHDISHSLLRSWIEKYRNKGISGLECRKKFNNPNFGKHNRKQSEVEKLKNKLAKKEIEIERLKKGYTVKGVGAKKEFVTIFDKNTK